MKYIYFVRSTYRFSSAQTKHNQKTSSHTHRTHNTPQKRNTLDKQTNYTLNNNILTRGGGVLCITTDTRAGKSRKKVEKK